MAVAEQVSVEADGAVGSRQRATSAWPTLAQIGLSGWDPRWDSSICAQAPRRGPSVEVPRRSVGCWEWSWQRRSTRSSSGRTTAALSGWTRTASR